MLVAYYFDLLLVPGADCDVATVTDHLNTAACLYRLWRHFVSKIVAVAECAAPVPIPLRAISVSVDPAAGVMGRKPRDNNPKQQEHAAHPDAAHAVAGVARAEVFHQLDDAPQDDEHRPPAAVPGPQP